MMMKALGVITLSVFIICISPVIGVLVGAFSGWVVSVLAPVWVTSGLGLLGIHIVATQLVELGAALGFLGGFFRVTKASVKD